MARGKVRKSTVKSAASSPFRLREQSKVAPDTKPLVHIIRKGVRCDTDTRGYAKPRMGDRVRIVVDASEGFIPLWSEGTKLYWRFRESSFQAFADPEAAKAATEQLLGEAVLAWGDAAPVKFVKRSDPWDFEVVARRSDDCDINGCVLASAFFPDAGRHKLTIYPKLFDQSEKEQRETLAHEIGHVFGLRHFFAQISERDWPSQIFGRHNKFSIMNYDGYSVLTARDKSDLKKLYRAVWSRTLTEINGTPIKLVKPFHLS